MLKTKIESLRGIRAVITTKWTKSGYRPLTVHSIEGYYVDTAIDNDADTWQIQVGDPDGDLMPMLQRDNEVRVQLYGFRPEGVSYIVTGMADDLGYSEEGVWTITGRDLSSLATDSTAPPQFLKHIRAQQLVKRQATALGFRQVRLTDLGVGKRKQSFKTLYTDGSESYWEFWHRLYRREKKWIWTEPDGTLVAADLNYEGQPNYYFGIPPRNAPRSMQIKYLPIEHAEWQKGMQKRFGEVWVYWQHGDNGHLTKIPDPTTAKWHKRPRKIIYDQDARTEIMAHALAREEIFEGKVGENELKITIPDPGFTIRVNRIAVVRIPDKDYANTMFVVGTRTQATPDGFVVEVRLREKQYAVSRRVPKDPKLESSSSDPTSAGATTLSSYLSGAWPAEWTEFYINAAQKWHGPWDFNLFLATLIGMGDVETGFENKRENGGPGGSGIIWYPWRGILDDRNDSPQRAPGTHDEHGRTIQQWQEIFANDPGSYVSRLYGVGPMQLTTTSFKEDADKLTGGKIDEYKGDRWKPENNIMVAAEVLRSCLKGAASDSGRDIDIWGGVARYNGGNSATGQANGATYAQKVKSKVVDPSVGYLAAVKDARKTAKEAADAARDGQSDSTGSGSGRGAAPPAGAPSKNVIRVFFSSYHPSLANATIKRQAIVYAAWWAYYTGPHTYGDSRGDQLRVKPPSVPGE